MTTGQITDYASLQTAIIEYLARDQDTTLAARIPAFIQFVESKANDKLFCRQMEAVDTLQTVANTETIDLPADFQSMRRFRNMDLTGKPFLTYKSPLQMDEYRLQNADVTGPPQFFTIYGDLIEFGPTPDAVYNLETVYRQYIPALSAENTTNWLLTLAPDFYLYGALVEASPYLKQDPRIATWASLFAAKIDDLNGLSLKSAFNAGPITVRPAGVNIW